MVMSALIEIEVAYAPSPTVQHLLKLTVPADITIAEAINLSGLPEIDLKKHAIGIFSEPRALTDKVSAGDRIEIYRPLLIDPMVARRLRVKQTAVRASGAHSQRNK